MDSPTELPDYGNIIEGALCMWDVNHDERLNDALALRVIEMLLDKYHFGDSDVSSTDNLLQEGFEMVVGAIEQDLNDLPNDTIVKVLGVIYFVAKRRAQGRRDYFEVIHTYVGLRAGPGMRILRHWDG